MEQPFLLTLTIVSERSINEMPVAFPRAAENTPGIQSVFDTQTNVDPSSSFWDLVFNTSHRTWDSDSHNPPTHALSDGAWHHRGITGISHQAFSLSD